MTQKDMTEYKLYELDRVIEDLTTLAHEPGCAVVIANYSLQERARRLRDLEADAKAMTGSNEYV